MNTLKQTVVGLSLAVLVVVLMAGWRIHVKLAATAHIQAVADEPASTGKLAAPAPIQAVADELASIGKFWAFVGATPPMPDKAGDKLLFRQSTEQGVGIFLLNVADGRKQLIHEQPQKFFDAGKFKIFGWSPDDSLFAYLQHEPKEWAASHIVICDGNTGKTVSTINIGGKTLHSEYILGIISGFAWLSPHSFAFLRKFGGDELDLVVLQQNAAGQWVLPRTFKMDTENPADMLAATSAHSVVWREGNILRSLDIDSGTNTQIFESTTNKLEGFSYSQDTRKFLLLCGDQTGDSLFEFTPPEKELGEIHPGSITNLGRISSPHNPVVQALWIDHEKGIAYLAQDLDQRTLFIKTNAAAAPVPLFSRGSVTSFTVNDNHIFLIGSMTNAPQGIWQYNLASKSLNCVYSSQEHPFQYAQYIVPLSKAFTNASGREITYHLWEPTGSASAKKSALLIGQSPHDDWHACPELTANGGDFFVSVDRPSFFDKEDVMAICAELAKDTRIDTNAVYLYATTEQSAKLASLVDEQPGLWKGVILFSPESFPDLSSLRHSKILIDDGVDDKGTIERVTKYQQAATEVGVSVTLALHKDAGHVYSSIATEREQAEQFARFLFGN